MSNSEVSKSSMTNSKAIASLILGVVGLIIGIIGLQEIKRLKQEGKKMAVSGIVCSSRGILLSIVLAIFGYMIFRALPFLKRLGHFLNYGLCVIADVKIKRLFFANLKLLHKQEYTYKLNN